MWFPNWFTFLISASFVGCIWFDEVGRTRQKNSLKTFIQINAHTLKVSRRRSRQAAQRARLQLFVIIWKEIWLKTHEKQWRKREKRPQAVLFNQIQYICHILSYTVIPLKVFTAATVASMWHVTWHTNTLWKQQDINRNFGCIQSIGCFVRARVCFNQILKYTTIDVLWFYTCSIHLICQTI